MRKKVRGAKGRERERGAEGESERGKSQGGREEKREQMYQCFSLQSEAALSCFATFSISMTS